MSTKEKAEIIRELMNKYDEYRSKWIKEVGSDKGFNNWFTKQIQAPKCYGCGNSATELWEGELYCQTCIYSLTKGSLKPNH